MGRAFETQLRNIPWAAFLPPPKFAVHAKRFFSHRIIPSIDLGEETDDEEQEKQQQQNLIEAILEAGKGKKASIHAEKERTLILNLLDSLTSLNKLLTHINSRKLQYQKG